MSEGVMFGTFKCMSIVLFSSKTVEDGLSTFGDKSVDGDIVDRLAIGGGMGFCY